MHAASKANKKGVKVLGKTVVSHSKAVLVLGDQLSPKSPAIRLAREESLPVLMVEASAEFSVVWTHKARIAVFLSAMRHFAQELSASGVAVHYSDLAQTDTKALSERVFELCQKLGVTELVLVEPGEWRLEQELVEGARQMGLSLAMLPDDHFLCSRSEFAKWASKYKQMRMEYFYREMRKQHQVLMDQDQPVGGQWNFDASNRKSFPKEGPGEIVAPKGFEPDLITQKVIVEVQSRFAEHPGQLEHFQWPVTTEQAQWALDHFIETRLAQFGDFQDAMWTHTPFGWHSLISSSINLHLLDPRDVIQKAEVAYRQGKASLEAVEGFIRQILGWREFIRGVYWLDMPKMRQDNFLKANVPLPNWFWTGQTQMACLNDCIGQTLKYGYAHHIQRLMVIGNFALLAGLTPQEVEDWFLAVYVDAVEWVELPNVAGMALFANGGRFTSKPYIAGGAYVNRMSNYCKNCRYKPTDKESEQACPFTVLYWAFIAKHEKLLQANPRTSLMVKNLHKLNDKQRESIAQKATWMIEHIESL